MWMVRWYQMYSGDIKRLSSFRSPRNRDANTVPSNDLAKLWAKGSASLDHPHKTPENQASNTKRENIKTRQSTNQNTNQTWTMTAKSSWSHCTFSWYVSPHCTGKNFHAQYFIIQFIPIYMMQFLAALNACTTEWLSLETKNFHISQRKTCQKSRNLRIDTVRRREGLLRDERTKCQPFDSTLPDTFWIKGISARTKSSPQTAPL